MVMGVVLRTTVIASRALNPVPFFRKLRLKKTPHEALQHGLKLNLHLDYESNVDIEVSAVIASSMAFC